MIDHLPQRRRASDRAAERARRAALVGDRTAFIVASGQAEAALRRRFEWVDRGERRPTEAVTAAID